MEFPPAVYRSNNKDIMNRARKIVVGGTKNVVAETMPTPAAYIKPTQWEVALKDNDALEILKKHFPFDRVIRRVRVTMDEDTEDGSSQPSQTPLLAISQTPLPVMPQTPLPAMPPTSQRSPSLSSMRSASVESDVFSQPQPKRPRTRATSREPTEGAASRARRSVEDIAEEEMGLPTATQVLSYVNELLM